MAISYNTLGGQVNITGGGTIPASDLNSTVALVGHYNPDTADGSVTPSEPTLVSSRTDAETLFGEQSELARQAALALANGAGTVYAIPVATSSESEAVTAASSGELTNTPLVDPRVTTYEITAVDGNEDSVNTIAVDGTPSSPIENNTIRINPLTGEWKATSSGDYDISYQTGAYDDAIASAVDLNPRVAALASEDPGAIITLQTDLATAASNFRFSRGVAGATPAIGPSEVADYTPTTDSWRVVEVAPSRGDDGDGEVRTVGAVAGLVASQPIDVTGSVTYDTLAGLVSLNEQYPPATASNYERVLAVTDEFAVAEGLTTASETAFADIYKAEIIDLIVEQLYERIKNYRGGSNAQPAQRKFRARIKRSLSAQATPIAQPPLLASGDGSRPYSVSVSTGATDSEAVVSVGIDPAPIAKTVTLDMSVGPIQFNGASV